MFESLAVLYRTHLLHSVTLLYSLSPSSGLGNLLTSLSVLPLSASTEALSLSVLSLTASRPYLY